ncbi:winged helix domain-containing protein [Marinovum sp.]|uniref:winged helix domain-containing protein n=1 Tax=Marinovum sp. TaxID=2024839 RepID=UPI002B27294F|nr:hypothetical protein [Marinovum sp.]
MAKLKSWGDAPFHITKTCGLVEAIIVGGRDRWALECLMAAGPDGCTPIDTPGPRWSGYVFNLRKLGIEIETVTESHDGPFSGTHARYVLRSTVTRVSKGNVA